MMNVWIFGGILVAWATVGVVGCIFQDNFKVNWCMIAFCVFVPFIPLIAKIFGIK